MEKQGRINLGDKLHRVTVRFNDKQFSYLTTMCDTLGVSVSEFLRMSVNAMIYSDREIAEKKYKDKEDLGRANDKQNIDDKL